MFRNRLRSMTLLAAAAAVGLSAAAANAGTMTLGTSGWEAQWPDTVNTVALSDVRVVGDTVYVTKTATFNTIDNLPIAFVQTDANALPRIAIDNESVTNNTGQAWTGFRWIILSSSTGTLADAQFNTTDTNIGGSGGFSIDPFTNHAYTDNSQTGTVAQPKVLDVFDGGLVADGGVFTPGEASGALIIHAAPNADPDQDGMYSFTLKELPSAIPLPAAFWSGLTGLAGLGLLRHRRKVL